MNKPLLIGIAGGTGSGKTTLTKSLVDHFGTRCSILYHDNYYLAQDNLTMEQRRRQNYDRPQAYETELLLKHLKMLKQGKPIDCPVYDYTVSNRSHDQVLKIEPRPVIIVEGILLFSDSRLRNLFDIKIFVDTDADVRILRRLRRDVEQRGRSLDSVIEQYISTVKPMHELYVEPSKRFADIIVPEGGKNLVALEMLIQRINSHIYSHRNRSAVYSKKRKDNVKPHYRNRDKNKSN